MILLENLKIFFELSRIVAQNFIQILCRFGDVARVFWYGGGGEGGS